MRSVIREQGELKFLVVGGRNTERKNTTEGRIFETVDIKGGPAPSQWEILIR